MAKQEKRKAVSATLANGTKVTATQEVIDKLKGAKPASKSTK